MEWSVQHIAELINARILGNSKVLISSWNTIQEAGPGDLTFLGNPAFAQYLEHCKASAAIVSENLLPENPPAHLSLLCVPDAQQAIHHLLRLLQEQENHEPQGIHEMAWVHPEASIHPEAWIGPGCVVEAGAQVGRGSQLKAQVFLGKQASVGDYTTLHPGVRILPQCTVGNHCILHPNVVLGGDGFGYRPGALGLEKIPHVGKVAVEDHVEIGSGSTIDRAMLGTTRIGFGCKIDNLVHIAHNVQVGAHSVIAAQTGLAGSVELGKACRIGGQVGIVHHVHLADHTQVAAQSGVMKSVKQANTELWGSPAMPASRYRKVLVLLKKLPELDLKLRSLEAAFKSNPK